MDYQHYPTTHSMSIRAWDKFKNKHVTRLLEPNIGDGALLAYGLQINRRSSFPIDCCEIDVKFHPTIKELSKANHHEIKLVAYDFMQLQNGAMYSHILMNPPFAYGAQHTLKAWDILWDGEIVSIINAETIRNPHTKERQHLVNLIQTFGEVEFISDAFNTSESERKTDVEIAIVYLRKKALVKSGFVTDWMSDLKVEKDELDKLDSLEDKNLPALPNCNIENTVIVFNMAVKSMKESVIAEEKATYYRSLITQKIDEVKEVDTENVGRSRIQQTYAKNYLELKENAWKHILKSSNFTDRLSSAAQDKLLSQFKEICDLEFTVSNIYGFLLGIIGNQAEIQAQMVCDVFDAFVTYHSENVHFYKGWKSNDKHRTCGMRLKSTRFISPRHEMWGTGPVHRTASFLRDIDKVFAMIDGKSQPEVSLEYVFTKECTSLRLGERVSSSYFDVRFYQGTGTIHFFPTNKVLIERLNRVVGSHRKWLPESDTAVHQDFWKQYEQADKFDSQLRALVKKDSKIGYYHRDPLYQLTCDLEAKNNDYDESRNLVVNQLDAIMVQKGIRPYFGLENATSSGQQTLLLEA